MAGYDYVVQQTTDGIGTYRKGNSGVIECGGTQPVTKTGSWTTGGGIKYIELGANNNTNYPSNLFTTTPAVITTETSGTDQGLGTSGTNIKTGPPYMILYRGASNLTSVAGSIHHRVMGT